MTICDDCKKQCPYPPDGVDLWARRGYCPFMERIYLIDEDDLDESKPRYWKFEYLGARMSLSYTSGTLRKIKDAALLASTLVATELEKYDYDGRVASEIGG